MDIEHETAIQLNRKRKRAKYEKNQKLGITRRIMSQATDETFFSFQAKLNCVALDYSQNHYSEEDEDIHRPASNEQRLDPSYGEITANNEQEDYISDTSNDSFDRSDEILLGQLTSDDPCESNSSNLQYLHDYTSLSTKSFCHNLMKLLRSACVCKSHSNRLIQLIQSILPIPNGFPSTLDDLLSLINFNDLFFKRSVCLQCKMELYYNQTKCGRCERSDETNVAFIYDVNISHVLLTTLKRLSNSIQNYKSEINLGSDERGTKDIPFGDLYQKLMNKNSTENIISLITHLDGISLTKSARLKMWLFSGCIVEIPPIHRYSRSNMMVMSIWISHHEPDTDIWLQNIVNELKRLKLKSRFHGEINIKAHSLR